jgi:DNA-binding response OmpR family regulator
VSERILLIDDDRELTAMLAEYLGRSGLRCEARHDVASGLRALREDGPFDLAILDVMLPDGDGLELCRTIRAESPIPIVMLTARGDDPDRIVGLELGADDYLAKPFNPRELQARVRAVLRRGRLAGGAAAGPLRFGRLEIDAAARRVRVDGEERPLTSAQFDLLRALAENAGRVMTRDALLQALRGRDHEPFDRSIDVHVSRIRAAIEDDPKRPRRILTVRGVGYVFPTRHDA